MASPHAATPASAKDAESGRHEDLRCGSHSSFSPASEHNQRLSRLCFIVEVAEAVARLFAVIFAVALCEDVPAIDHGVQQACSWLRAASRTLGGRRALAAREAAR